MQTFYHVLIDTNFYYLKDLYNGNDIEFVTFGDLRNYIDIKNMPIVYDINDAKFISSRMIESIKKNGSNINNSKCYPIFGTIIIKMQIELNNNDIENIENINYEDNGTRKYSELNKIRKLVIYNTIDKNNNHVKRGILDKTFFKKIKLISAEYFIENKKNLDEDIKWSIMNSYDNLSSYDIRCLKYIFDSNKEVNIEYKNNNIIYNNIEKKNISVSYNMNTNGGNYSNQKKLEDMDENELRRQVRVVKQQYLQKKKELNMTGPMTGGNYSNQKNLEDMDENELRRQVRNVKQQYLQKKKELNMTGGRLDENDLRRKVRDIKQQYLQKKREI